MNIFIFLCLLLVDADGQTQKNRSFTKSLKTRNSSATPKHLTENEYQMNNKNAFLKGQIVSSDLMKKHNGEKIDDNIRGQTQSKLKQDHLQDSRGILYTKKSGLVKNLFFGHGDQKNFEKSEYATTYL